MSIESVVGKIIIIALVGIELYAFFTLVELIRTKGRKQMSKYFNDERYCHCFDIPTSNYLGVCKGCRGYVNICYSCDRCLHCWFTSQVELFTEYDEPKLLELIENWNKFYQIRKTINNAQFRREENQKRQTYWITIPRKQEEDKQEDD